MEDRRNVRVPLAERPSRRALGIVSIGPSMDQKRACTWVATMKLQRIARNHSRAEAKAKRKKNDASPDEVLEPPARPLEYLVQGVGKKWENLPVTP